MPPSLPHTLRIAEPAPKPASGARPHPGAASERDWQAFNAELRARVPELAVELLGRPRFRTRQEWRWGRKGSLSLVIAGAKAGMWFDHEAGQGGGFVDLLAQHLGLSRRDGLDWIAERIGMGHRPRPIRQRSTLRMAPANPPTQPAPRDADETEENTSASSPAAEAAARAARIWSTARPAPADHPYLTAKQAAPLTLRLDARGQLVVPLQDGDGNLHSLEFIAPDGAKRYLAGGAKRGHFAVVASEPARLAEPTGPVLICEGWATGASLHIATGHTTIAAMDAGSLGYLPFAQSGGQLLFHLISRLYERTSVIVTTNLAFGE